MNNISRTEQLTALAGILKGFWYPVRFTFQRFRNTPTGEATMYTWHSFRETLEPKEIKIIVSNEGNEGLSITNGDIAIRAFIERTFQPYLDKGYSITTYEYCPYEHIQDSFCLVLPGIKKSSWQPADPGQVIYEIQTQYRPMQPYEIWSVRQ